MKKNIMKKAAVFLLSTIVAAQSGLSVQAAALTKHCKNSPILFRWWDELPAFDF